MSGDPMLTALRFSDSFLPVGGDSLSYGLEQLVQDGRVEDATDLRGLIESYLTHQIGPCDMVALDAAHTAGRDGALDRVAAVDERYTAVTLAPEFRESARRSGRRLLEVGAETIDEPRLDDYAGRVRTGAAIGNHPVVLGLVTAVQGVSERDAKRVLAHSFVTGLLGAAQRLLRLGHTDAQRILTTLHSTMIDAIEANVDRSVDAMTPFTPLIDVAAANHEHASRRLFLS